MKKILVLFICLLTLVGCKGDFKVEGNMDIDDKVSVKVLKYDEKTWKETFPAVEISSLENGVHLIYNLKNNKTQSYLLFHLKGYSATKVSFEMIGKRLVVDFEENKIQKDFPQLYLIEKKEINDFDRVEINKDGKPYDHYNVIGL